MLGKMKDRRRIFIMIDTDPAKDEKVEERLMTFDEIFEVHFISGQYDILAVAEIEFYGHPVFSDVQDLSHTLVQKIRKIPGVRDTNTMIPLSSLVKS